MSDTTTPEVSNVDPVTGLPLDYIQASAKANPDTLALIASAMKTVINVKEGETVKVLRPTTAVVRNGVALPLFITDIERVKQGSEKAGVTYLAPHVQWIKDNTQAFLTWVGDVIVRRWAGSKLKAVLQGLNEEACADLVGPDGNIEFYPNKNPKIKEPKPDYQQFNMQDFVDLAEELSPRSETMAEINMQIKDTANELADLDLPDPATEQQIADFRAAKMVLKRQIQSLVAALNNKKRHKASDLSSGEEESTPNIQAATTAKAA